MSHPSLLLLCLDGHFETTPDYDFDVHDILPNFPDVKAQVKRTPREDELFFGYLAKFLPPTGYEPKEFDKITSVGNDTRLINDPDHCTSVSVAESMLMKSRRNSIRSHSIQTHKEFYSDERDFREHLEMKSSTSCSWWKFSFPKFGTKKFRMRVIRVATRAWISKTTISGRYSLDRSSSTWKNIFV